MSTSRRLLRCAVYTRVSTEYGLEQEFNSLDAQREACEAYITSQKHEGWSLLPARYDDGGYSGGSMERPALKALLADIGAGRVDVVVVYKVDRLTRSLADFAKLVELFDARSISFVSVTQSFNTTSSMGRLTLNVLLSFAQFEREVTGERIRDKIAASKKKGMRVGGPVALGYTVQDKKLVPEPAEAETVRLIFSRYLEVGCLNGLVEELRSRGIVTKLSGGRSGAARGGIPFSKGPLGFLLRNRVYIGEMVHKGRHYRGEHEPIVPADLFEAVQQELDRKARSLGASRVNQGALLSGRLYDDRGNRMTATTAKKGGVRYRYYTSAPLLRGERDAAGAVARVSAPEIEDVVLAALHVHAPGTEGENPDSGDDMHSPKLPFSVDRVTVRRQAIEINWAAGEDGTRREPLIVPWTSRTSTQRRALISLDAYGPDRPIRSETRARLVNGIARARRWLDGLVSGRFASTQAIAEHEGCSERTVRTAINLAFLSPTLVKAAVEGTLPHGISSGGFYDCEPEWAAQERSNRADQITAGLCCGS